MHSLCDGSWVFEAGLICLELGGLGPILASLALVALCHTQGQAMGWGASLIRPPPHVDAWPESLADSLFPAVPTGSAWVYVSPFFRDRRYLCDHPRPSSERLSLTFVLCGLSLWLCFQLSPRSDPGVLHALCPHGGS